MGAGTGAGAVGSVLAVLEAPAGGFFRPNSMNLDPRINSDQNESSKRLRMTGQGKSPAFAA
jgi:hypothetical protein